MNKEVLNMKVFILQKIGVYDYEVFSSIELVTTDEKEVKAKYEELKNKEIEHFKNNYENGENRCHAHISGATALQAAQKERSHPASCNIGTPPPVVSFSP